MAGFNRIIIVGNLTRDPDFKQLNSGQNVCRLGIASNRQFKNRQSGDMVQEVCYVDVDVWGPQADSCKQYLAKGRQVLIEGRLKLDSWQDTEGQNRSKHSIVADRVVFLTSGANDSSADVADQSIEPRNEVERELMSQLDEIKSRAQGGAVAAKAAPRASKPTAQPASFKDEPPFQDDLPF